MSIPSFIESHEIFVYIFELETVDLQCSYVLIGGIKAGNGNDLPDDFSDLGFTAAAVGSPKEQYCLR